MSKAGESQDKFVAPQGSSLLADPVAPVLVDEQRRSVERVLDSATFRRSPRLKEFLRYAAEQTLAGQTEHLTESEIGRLVFQRGEDYIPTDDSIVRSSARQLRMKLREYFDTEGQHEHWVIEIPKGGYAVHFRERVPEAGEAGPPVEILATVAHELALPPRESWLRRLALPLGVLLLVSSLALNLWFWRKANAAAAAAPPAQLSLLGHLVMNSPRTTQFIMDDYAFVLLSHASRRKATLEEYANRSYIDPDFVPTKDPAFLKLWDLLSSRYLVSFGAAAAAEDALRAVPQQQKLLIRHARNVAPREFKQGNFILFGSPPNNPWAELFEDRLNFHKSDLGFVNGHPRAGEPATYYPRRSLKINSGVGYARIAYLSNDPGGNGPGKGFVLLLTGINMVTSEAAAEFASDPGRLPELLRITGAPNVGSLPHFELLLETSAVDTTPKDVRVIAYRRMQ